MQVKAHHQIGMLEKGALHLEWFKLISYQLDLEGDSQITLLNKNPP